MFCLEFGIYCEKSIINEYIRKTVIPQYIVFGIWNLVSPTHNRVGVWNLEFGIIRVSHYPMYHNNRKMLHLYCYRVGSQNLQ